MTEGGPKRADPAVRGRFWYAQVWRRMIWNSAVGKRICRQLTRQKGVKRVKSPRAQLEYVWHGCALNLQPDGRGHAGIQ